MNTRSLAVSPYAMMASLLDTDSQSTASQLLCAMVRERCSEEVLIKAVVLAHEFAIVSDARELGDILEHESMGYLFFGVVHDPEYQAEIAEERRALHPSFRPPSVAQHCVVKVMDAVRAAWLTHAGYINERVYPAYNAALEYAVLRHLHITVHSWADRARSEQWELLGGACEFNLDYGVNGQRGYAQLRVDLFNSAMQMLEIEERRAMVLEKDGALPRR